MTQSEHTTPVKVDLNGELVPEEEAQVSVFDDEIEDVLPPSDVLEEVTDDAAAAGEPEASANTLEEIVPVDTPDAEEGAEKP